MKYCYYLSVHVATSTSDVTEFNGVHSVSITARVHATSVSNLECDWIFSVSIMSTGIITDDTTSQPGEAILISSSHSELSSSSQVNLRAQANISNQFCISSLFSCGLEA